MTLEEFVGKGWEDHADDATGVWTRLPEGIALVDSTKRLFPLANLATHVAGEHLGRWEEGVAFLDRLAALPVFDPAAAEAKGVRRLQAVLLHCAGRTPERDAALELAQVAGLRPETVRIRMLAVAASALAHHGRIPDADAAFGEALRLAEYGPDAADPAARELAITGNNLACDLENRPARTEAETAMMLHAAAIGRRFWEISGDWRNVERAEYRLAMAHTAAGLPAQALVHARECLRIVEAHGSEPGEAFFAHECASRALLAARDTAGARAERDAAAAMLPLVADDGSREFCAGELTKLDADLG